MATKFARLLEPGKIGNLSIKNRIVMPAMGTHWAPEDGQVVQRQIDHYVDRARGGAGLIITEASCVQFPIGRGFMEISCDNDRHLPGLIRLADAIKSNGAGAILQLHHAGAASNRKLTRGVAPVAPSAVVRHGAEPLHALTIQEIKDIVARFVDAAVRAQKAGFDGVEIHGAHHYLIAQFHSPAWNERTDEYGGSVENRARIGMEIVRGIKSRIPWLPVIFRLDAQEFGSEEFFGKPGLTLEDGKQIARLIEGCGADALHVSAWGWGMHSMKNTPIVHGELLPLAQAVKQVVSIPIITVGQITPEIGEKALREKRADFVAIGRGLLADPYLPEKIRTGSAEDIAPCIACLECLGEPRTITCSVNARSGQEAGYPYPLAKAAAPKKVVVVGGGPGGLEAARVAALRGHDVTLFEKSTELGGKLGVVDKMSIKENTGLLAPYLVRQVKKLGVKIRPGAVATAETVLRLRPDAVIVATGAIPVKPAIEGLDRANVVDAIEFLAGRASVGKRVVVIGGEMVGCEAADVLAESGLRDVTIVRRGPELLTKMRIGRLRQVSLLRLQKAGVKFELGATYKSAGEAGLTIMDKGGKERLLRADTIVIAAGAVSDNELARELTGKGPQVIVVGDAMEPRKIINAVREGFKAAYSL